MNLGFNHGTQLDDPDGLLEGTGKLIRHIRLNKKSQLRSKSVKNLIAAAVVHARELAESKGGIQPARVGIRIGKNSGKKTGGKNNESRSSSGRSKRKLERGSPDG